MLKFMIIIGKVDLIYQNILYIETHSLLELFLKVIGKGIMNSIGKMDIMGVVFNEYR